MVMPTGIGCHPNIFCFLLFKLLNTRVFQDDPCFAYRKYKLEEVNKHEILKHHPNCVQFIKAWEERLVAYPRLFYISFSLETYPIHRVVNLV